MFPLIIIQKEGSFGLPDFTMIPVQLSILVLILYIFQASFRLNNLNLLAISCPVPHLLIYNHF